MHLHHASSLTIPVAYETTLSPSRKKRTALFSLGALTVEDSSSAAAVQTVNIASLSSARKLCVNDDEDEEMK